MARYDDYLFRSFHSDDEEESEAEEDVHMESDDDDYSNEGGFHNTVEDQTDADTRFTERFDSQSRWTEQLARVLNLDNETKKSRLNDNVAKNCESWLRNADDGVKAQIQSIVMLPKDGSDMGKPDFQAMNSIIGMHQVKRDLMECIVYPTIRPRYFQGLRSASTAILMFGPPGTGKTYAAAKVAESANRAFFNVSGSVLTSKFVGDGEKALSLVFNLARCFRPSVVFFDEVDSFLSARGGAAESESGRKLKTEFLTQFDGVGKDNDGVLYMAATNLPFDLDTAVIRRFPRRVLVDLPEQADIVQLIKGDVNADEVQFSLEEDDYKEIAKRMHAKSYSTSDIKNTLKSAAMEPLRDRLQDINTLEQLEDADESLRAVTKDDFDKAMENFQPSFQRNVTNQKGRRRYSFAYSNLLQFYHGNAQLTPESYQLYLNSTEKKDDVPSS